MESYILGIDVGGTNIKIMIMNENYHIVSKCSLSTERHLGYEKISDNIIEMIEQMFHDKGEEKPKVLSVAMGLPGIVDKENGKTIYLAALRWDGFNPCEKIGKRFHAPFFIDNDANINVLGEYKFGKHAVTKNMGLVTLGTGVGGGIIANGQIFGGVNNVAVELGHMIIVADGGEICLCGRRGHLEAYCSGTALEDQAMKMIRVNKETVLHKLMEELNGKYDNSLLVEGYKCNDEVCVQIIDRFIHYLSIGLANIMSLYNPEIIVLGGGISNASEIILEPLNALCKKMVLNEYSYCPIIKASLGAEAGMFGACALAGQSIGLKLP